MTVIDRRVASAVDVTLAPPAHQGAPVSRRGGLLGERGPVSVLYRTGVAKLHSSAAPTHLVTCSP